MTNSLQAGGVTGLLEFFSMLQRGTVFYYDGRRMDKVAAELGVPSAVALSTDHRFVVNEQTKHVRVELAKVFLP